MKLKSEYLKKPCPYELATGSISLPAATVRHTKDMSQGSLA